MFYDVPDCLSANSGIESLYLKAAGQLADKGSYIDTLVCVRKR